MSPWRSVVSRPAWASGVMEPAAKRRRSASACRPSNVPSMRVITVTSPEARGREAARVDQHVDEPRAPAQRLAAGRVHLAEHGHELALVVLDRDLDLRVDQVVAAQERRSASP